MQPDIKLQLQNEYWFDLTNNRINLKLNDEFFRYFSFRQKESQEIIRSVDRTKGFNKIKGHST